MKTEIKSEHVCWHMDYQDGEQEQVFEEENALAFLLVEGVIFLNTNWSEKDWPQAAQDSTRLLVNCNDIFMWGCADAEEIYQNELNTLWNYYCKDPKWGPSIWCMKKRGMLPQHPVYTDVQKDTDWDLDKMKLDPNPSWPKKAVFK